MSASSTWTISAVRDALRTKEISARELTKDFFARIENRNRELNAFLALSIDRAYAQADRIDAMIAKGERPAAARRRSHRHQGRDQHPWRRHDLRLQDPRDLRPAL